MLPVFEPLQLMAKPLWSEMMPFATTGPGSLRVTVKVVSQPAASVTTAV